MSRYYFDTSDGLRATNDDLGGDYPNREAVRAAAIGALPDLARDELPNGDEYVFSVKVRDHGGKYIFQATLSLLAEWLDSDADDHN